MAYERYGDYTACWLIFSATMPTVARNKHVENRATPENQKRNEIGTVLRFAKRRIAKRAKRALSGRSKVDIISAHRMRDPDVTSCT